MTTRPNKYQKQATLGIVGLLFVASPFFLKLPFQFASFSASTQLENETALSIAQVAQSEELERTRIAQRKETADKLKETGVLPSGDKLKIRDYYDNSKWNPKPNVTGFLADEIIYVYDSAGACIGKIQNRKWLWKHFYANVCVNAPVQ
ncbi:hypothetical protein H6F96_10090 [Microcoleus sp. FACHB-53]|nr:hypothetical protein [Microcoleus sp. FACHB-53]